MNRNSIGVFVVLIIVVISGWLLFSNTPTAEAPVTNQMPVIGSTTPEIIVEKNIVTILYGDQFSPKNITILPGTTVEFVDRSPGKDMWVASAMHPTHAVYSGTNLSQHCPDTLGTAFDQCGTGTSYIFTFNKIGTWNYHNHRNATDFGTIIVAPTN